MYGVTPLALSSSLGDLNTVRLLVEEGEASVDDVCDEGITPLMRASAGGHEAVVELLLSLGAGKKRMTREKEKERERERSSTGVLARILHPMYHGTIDE